MMFQFIKKILSKNQKIQQKRVFEKRLFKVLVITGCFSVCLYVYSLSSAIYGVVERRALEKEVTKIQAHISILEATYLSRVNAITYTEVALLGYEHPQNIYYESQERVAFQTNTNKTN